MSYILDSANAIMLVLYHAFLIVVKRCLYAVCRSSPGGCLSLDSCFGEVANHSAFCLASMPYKYYILDCKRTECPVCLY